MTGHEPVSKGPRRLRLLHQLFAGLTAFEPAYIRGGRWLRGSTYSLSRLCATLGVLFAVRGLLVHQSWPYAVLLMALGIFKQFARDYANAWARAEYEGDAAIPCDNPCSWIRRSYESGRFPPVPQPARGDVRRRSSPRFWASADCAILFFTGTLPFFRGRLRDVSCSGASLVHVYVPGVFLGEQGLLAVKSSLRHPDASGARPTTPSAYQGPTGNGERTHGTPVTKRGTRWIWFWRPWHCIIGYSFDQLPGDRAKPADCMLWAGPSRRKNRKDAPQWCLPVSKAGPDCRY